MKPIEESLLGLAGIEQAHVRLSDDGPAGVRIVLAADADRASVAASIRELFTTRGLTVAVADSQEVPMPTAAGGSESADPIMDTPSGQPVAEQAGTQDVPSGDPTGVEAHAASPDPIDPPLGGTAGPEPAIVTSPADLAVAVSEGPLYCDIAVRVGPRRSVRRSSLDLISIREAILDALNEATGRAGIRPTIVSVDERTVSQKTMITVVLEASGQVGVGSALVRGTEFHAFAIAATAALRYLPSF